MPNSFPKDLASSVHDELRRHHTPNVNPNILTGLFETLYFASMETEELQPITCYIVYLDPENVDPNPPDPAYRGSDYWQPVRFSSAVLLNTPNLVKLAKATDPRTSSFAVYPDPNFNDQLSIWGLVDQGNLFHDFVNHESDTTFMRPGLFQASILGIGHIAAYIGFEKIGELKTAALLGTSLNVLAHGKIRAALESSIQRHCEAVKASLIEQGTLADDFVDDTTGIFRRVWGEELAEYWISSLARLLLRAQNFRHGGAILITPDSSSDKLAVRQSIQYPRLRHALQRQGVRTIQLAVCHAKIQDDCIDKEAKEIPIMYYRDELRGNDELNDSRNELDGTIWFISLLTRVDGLVLMNSDLEVQGFSVLIREIDVDPLEFVIAEDEDAAHLLPFPFDRFGTRHQTMMRYCAHVPGSVGFVVSQDGDVRAMTQVAGRVVMWQDIQLQRYIETKRLKRSDKKIDKQATGSISQGGEKDGDGA